MRKVVITGPECSGKTTLALALARAMRGRCVGEAARGYLDALARPYEEKDLPAIARAQLAGEDRAMEQAGADGLVVCDTDLLTLRIWSEEKYGRCDPWIIRQTEQRPYALWLLCRPDIPWEPDPQRENPHDRDRLFARHEELLRELEKPFVIMEGEHPRRLRKAIDLVEMLPGA